MKKRVPLLILSTLFLTSCSLPDFLESFLPTKETIFSEEEKKTEAEETNETSVTTEEVLTETVSELETEPQTEYFPDPYTNVDESEFYRNYTPATSYLDSYYRTQHHLMSGSIEDQKQRPTIAENQPKDGDKYVANSKDGTSKDGLSYDIVDTSGKVVNTIYKGGAYVILEEVAAYLYAFGEIPANYVTNKSTKPTESPWGKYLRLNHSYFTCDTTKYKYEPDLPDTSSKRYYEIDVGTTGSFEYSTARVGEYNNGKSITRGAVSITEEVISIILLTAMFSTRLTTTTTSSSILTTKADGVSGLETSPVEVLWITTLVSTRLLIRKSLIEISQ